jgi:hypothetical protein
MSRKMQLKVMVAGVLATIVIGVTSVAVALDRWDVHTQYDQTIYYSATFVIFLVVQAVMRLVRK